MAAHETQIGRAIRIDEGRTGHYCKVVNHDFLECLNRQKPKTMQRLADCWYEGNHASYGRTQHYASPKPQQTDNEKYAMRCWMLRLGFIGDEFETAREILLKNMDGNAAWRQAAC